MQTKLIALLGGALSLGLVNAASAADMAVKARPVAAPIVAYNWTGCYIGGNVGGGWAKVDQLQVGKVTPPAVINPPGDFGSSTGSNFIGGAQIGCDYQFAGNWVVGVQGMFDFGNINSRHTLPAFPTFYSENSTKNEFTVTGRVGYLFAPQLLGYVKGGGAWARIDNNIYGTVPVNFLSESASVTRSGWTVGAGLEWMFAPGWSVFGEFNYMDFGNLNTNYTRGPLAVVNSEDVIRTRLQVEQFLVGVNYKFNFGGPVVAKY